jgi:hypothetical protein
MSLSRGSIRSASLFSPEPIVITGGSSSNSPKLRTQNSRTATGGTRQLFCCCCCFPWVPLLLELLVNDRIRERWHNLWFVRYPDMSQKIDLLARIFFPLLFLVFNAIVILFCFLILRTYPAIFVQYWTTYLVPYIRDSVDEF